jgi:hypothetical protein
VRAIAYDALAVWRIAMASAIRRSSSCFVAAIAVASFAVHTGRAQTWNPPRTPWGDPDLQGVWNYATMTPLERPRDVAEKEAFTADEAAAYEQRTNERQASTNNTAGPDWWDPGTKRLLASHRTALIIDPASGRLPPLTPEAQQRAAERAQASRERSADGPEDFALNVRCLLWSTAGPPMLPGVYNNNVQFVQTRANIVIVNEMIHDARIVPMDGRPHGTLRRWMGEPRGRWEGATLVVDSTNFTSTSAFRGSGERLHLVERFTRVDATTIEYRFTAEDPDTWTRPWTASFPMTRTNDLMYEYACHEGNFRSMEGLFRGRER